MRYPPNPLPEKSLGQEAPGKGDNVRPPSDFEQFSYLRTLHVESILGIESSQILHHDSTVSYFRLCLLCVVAANGGHIRLKLTFCKTAMLFMKAVIVPSMLQPDPWTVHAKVMHLRWSV